MAARLATTLAAATARTCGPAAAATCTTSATGTACAAATAGRHGLRDRRLRPENLNERLVGALLVGISAAHANRADHLIVHYDGQTAANEVVRQALLLAEIQANQPAVNVLEAMRPRRPRMSGRKEQSWPSSNQFPRRSGSTPSIWCESMI